MSNRPFEVIYKGQRDNGGLLFVKNKGRLRCKMEAEIVPCGGKYGLEDIKSVLWVFGKGWTFPVQEGRTRRTFNTDGGLRLRVIITTKDGEEFYTYADVKVPTK